ncbi:MAG: hypothetical protein NC324_02470 [Bacteroides sp.]|nr:hypothetical protein [Bacteroides sp.]
MRLDSIAPNAHYDMVGGKPAVLQQDNDGSTLYRFNIAPETGVPDGETEERQIGWQCVEVRTFERPTKANLKKAIIRSILDETEEFSLVNSYNKHMLGIAVSEKAVEAYKEYLQMTEDLESMLSKTL